MSVGLTARAVLSGRQTVNAFEVLGEVSLVAYTDSAHDLFHVQKRRLDQFLRATHAECLEVLRRRHAGLHFEEMSKAGGRQVYGLRDYLKRQLPVKLFLHVMNGGFYTLIHTGDQVASVWEE